MYNIHILYIIVIFCLKIRQNQHNLIFLASSYREVWKILILALSNINVSCYRLVHLWNFQTCQVKLLKYWQMLWPLSKFWFWTQLSIILFLVTPSAGAKYKISSFSLIGYSNTYYPCCNLGNFHYFSHIFGSSAVKAMAFSKISSFSSYNPLLALPCALKLCLMYGQMGNFLIFLFFSVWLIGH